MQLRHFWASQSKQRPKASKLYGCRVFQQPTTGERQAAQDQYSAFKGIRGHEEGTEQVTDVHDYLDRQTRDHQAKQTAV